MLILNLKNLGNYFFVRLYVWIDKQNDAMLKID